MLGFSLQMKTIILNFLALFFCQSVLSQKSIGKDVNSIYLVCRSSQSKKNIIAEDFNLKDSLVTHIGLGYVENDSLMVFNVSNDKKNRNNSSLLKESLNSFFKQDGIDYYSVWEYKTNSNEMNKLKSVIAEYLNRKIDFDFSFRMNKNDELYCSEFVHEVLLKTNAEKFYFLPETRKLNPFYSRALHRETLEYIPVDFFTKFNVFTKVYEQHF